MTFRLARERAVMQLTSSPAFGRARHEVGCGAVRGFGTTCSADQQRRWAWDLHGGTIRQAVAAS